MELKPGHGAETKVRPTVLIVLYGIETIQAIIRDMVKKVLIVLYGIET